jgi:dihydrofolate synthase/folylpolyglutamate synthase
VAGRDFTSAWLTDGTLAYRGIHVTLSGIPTGIPGRYQVGNAALALAAGEVLDGIGLPISREALAGGLRVAQWPGRMELIAGQPAILLDGAHNPAGAAALADALGDYRYRRIHLVAGIMADKDAAGIFSPLVPKIHRAYAVTPAVERALDDTTLAGILTQLGMEAIASGDVANGIASARQAAGEGDLILVCGSLFTVGEAKAWLTQTHFEGIRG